MLVQTVFAIVPLTATIAYIPGLFSSSATAGQRLIQIICIMSLAATAYTMQTSTFSMSKDSVRRTMATTDWTTWLRGALSEENRRYLNLANSTLCVLLALGSLYAVDALLYLLPGGKLLRKNSNRYQTLTRITICSFPSYHIPGQTSHLRSRCW